MIETVDISKNKRKIPLKLFKILLLYLISLYIDKGAKQITLYADSSYGQKNNNSKYEGNELRLACYYESLGFKPVKEDEINKYVNLCIEKMNKKDYENLISTCILSNCQKQKIDIGIRFNFLKVKMSTIIPNILNYIGDILEDMNCYENIRKL